MGKHGILGMWEDSWENNQENPQGNYAVRSLDNNSTVCTWWKSLAWRLTGL